MYNYLEVINLNLNELNCINENINLDEYIDFREKVKKQMEYPEWLGDLSKDDLIKLINSDSKIWIYYLNEEPVCSMMLIPSDEKSLLKLELPLDYKYAASTIHPDNIYSITNFIKDNFEHKNTKTFKRGIRNIYLKQLID